MIDETLLDPTTDRAEQRILVVDDEAIVRTIFSSFLEDKYPCDTASSSDEALAMLAQTTYALVMSDIQMPGRNGVELLREIRSRYPDTAVMMVSGIDRPQRIRDALHLGAVDYLTKPCDMDVLGFSVDRALERRELMLTTRTYRADLERQNVELASSKAQLERLQAQIVHSEKMAGLGQLAAGVAHELNNPAGFIYGNMDLIRGYLGRLELMLSIYERVNLPAADAAELAITKLEIGYDKLLPDLRSMIADCVEGAERIRDVVKNLRLFSRLDDDGRPRNARLESASHDGDVVIDTGIFVAAATERGRANDECDDCRNTYFHGHEFSFQHTKVRARIEITFVQ